MESVLTKIEPWDVENNVNGDGYSGDRANQTTNKKVMITNLKTDLDNK